MKAVCVGGTWVGECGRKLRCWVLCFAYFAKKYAESEKIYTTRRSVYVGKDEKRGQDADGLMIVRGLLI